MPSTSLLTLIDDIAAILDDVAVMTKVAAKKTAGVLGDDLALNAQQVSGVRADRELPVVWAVAKGSALNKLILVPSALLISAFLPVLIKPLLMIGGAYLCFEGFEKIVHKLLRPATELASEHQQVLQALQDERVDMVEFEKKKIKGAIRTDFILSAEIIVIALGSAQDASLAMQAMVVCSIAVLMTVGVYGLVAAIVKLDDVGLYLISKESAADNSLTRLLGRAILWFSPALMRLLSIVGTAAMFLVGGGIILHGLPHSHDVLHYIEHSIEGLSYIGIVFSAILPTVLNALVGLMVGGVLVLLIVLKKRLL